MSLSGLARLLIATTVSRTVIRSYFPFFRSCRFRRAQNAEEQPATEVPYEFQIPRTETKPRRTNETNDLSIITTRR